MTKSSILQEDVTTVNIHETNNRALKYINQKENNGLNQTLEQMDQTDIYKTFHPIVAEYIPLR